MKELLESFKKTINPYKKCSQSVDIGNICSFLHSNITVYFLFGCFLLVSSHQHFGKPIQCLQDNFVDELTIPENAINNYCFMATTYSVVDSSPIDEQAYEGVGPDLWVENPSESVTRHAYYQWVPLVLLLQASMFMIPHWVWKGCEGGLVKKLVAQLDDDLETRMPRLSKPKNVKHVAKYFYSRLGCTNSILGTTWIFCDILALLNVMGNFFLIDKLFDGMFMKFGLTGLRIMAAEPAQAPLFPLLTKCTFHSYGSSGTIQTHDSICVMTLNVVNEKVFLLLWGWFFILAVLTVLFIFGKFLRIYILKFWSTSYIESTIGVPTLIAGNDLRKCVSIMSFGDCVLFHILAKNMRPMTYKGFVKCLAYQIETKKNEKFL